MVCTELRRYPNHRPMMLDALFRSLAADDDRVLIHLVADEARGAAGVAVGGNVALAIAADTVREILGQSR